MRIFTCQLDDRIHLDGEISIVITKISQNQASLGIRAPASVRILRKETVSGGGTKKGANTKKAAGKRQP